MFYGFPTVRGTGIEIYGDYSDLSLLYSTVHHLSDKDMQCPQITSGQFKILMNFAYELRKAKNGERLRKEINYAGNTANTYFGFQLVWTDALFFLHVMKHNATYVKCNKLQEAILCFFEHVITSALREYDEEGAENIIAQIGGLNVKDRYIFLLYQAVHNDFVCCNPGKQRFRAIAKMLFSDLSPYAAEYQQLMTSLKEVAALQQCKVKDLQFEEIQSIIW